MHLNPSNNFKAITLWNGKAEDKAIWDVYLGARYTPNVWALPMKNKAEKKPKILALEFELTGGVNQLDADDGSHYYPDGSFCARAVLPLSNAYRIGLFSDYFFNSIYDGKDVTPIGVKKGLIDTLKKCCDKLLKQLNEDGQKVDFIIATDGYNLSGLPENYFGYNFGYKAISKLNNTPIDTSTEDYQEFSKNPNLMEKDDIFTTDYKGLSDLIIISSNKKVIEREDIKFYDVEPIYTRERNKVIETIISKMKIVFIVDGIEFIDGMSFDFLKEILNQMLILAGRE